MNKPDVKKLILLNLPYVFAFYFADKIAAVFRLAPGTAFIDRLTNGFAVFGTAFANPLPSFHPVDLLIGVLAGALLKLAVYVKGKNRKKFRQGEEYGSARWGKPEDIKPYMDPEFSNNVILTQTEFLTMNSRPKQPKYARNKNILVIGGSGSGKTRFFVKPNLMQMHSSYVVTDPKGTVLVECGKMLEKGGYVIKSLNTINFRKSMHYNPFSYIRSEKDILKLVNTIIVNTKGDGDKSGEDFWVKAEKLYYTALIGYIWYEAPDHEKNFTTIEVASDTTHPYKVTDAAYQALITLLADICKRNGIKSLRWKADKSLIGKVEQQNMTVHRWFAPKACPGDYLYNLHGQIAAEVNKRLGVSGSTAPVVTPSKSTTPYRVRVKIKNLNIRKGPGTQNASNGFIAPGVYTIVSESKGSGASMWGKLKSGAGWISLDYCEKL